MIVRMLPAATHLRGQDRIGVLGGLENPSPIYVSQVSGQLRDQKTGAALGGPGRAPEVSLQEEADKEPQSHRLQDPSVCPGRDDLS